MTTQGERLKAAIKAADLTQVSFAEKLGVSINTVWRWCADKQGIPDSKKRKIAETLGITVSHLMGEEERESLSVDAVFKNEAMKNALMEELAGLFSAPKTVRAVFDHASKAGLSVPEKMHTANDEELKAFGEIMRDYVRNNLENDLQKMLVDSVVEKIEFIPPSRLVVHYKIKAS